MAVLALHTRDARLAEALCDNVLASNISKDPLELGGHDGSGTGAIDLVAREWGGEEGEW